MVLCEHTLAIEMCRVTDTKASQRLCKACLLQGDELAGDEVHALDNCCRIPLERAFTKLQVEWLLMAEAIINDDDTTDTPLTTTLSGLDKLEDPSRAYILLAS